MAEICLDLIDYVHIHFKLVELHFFTLYSNHSVYSPCFHGNFDAGKGYCFVTGIVRFNFLESIGRQTTISTNAAQTPDRRDTMH
jgi:hypothetical protein